MGSLSESHETFTPLNIFSFRFLPIKSRQIFISSLIRAELTKKWALELLVQKAFQQPVRKQFPKLCVFQLSHPLIDAQRGNICLVAVVSGSARVGRLLTHSVRAIDARLMSDRAIDAPLCDVDGGLGSTLFHIVSHCGTASHIVTRRRTQEAKVERRKLGRASATGAARALRAPLTWTPDTGL